MADITAQRWAHLQTLLARHAAHKQLMQRQDSPCTVVAPAMLCSGGSLSSTDDDPQEPEVVVLEAYCLHQPITPEINAIAVTMIRALRTASLLDTATPYRHGRGRRIVCSLKEVIKAVPEARLIVVAPDVRPCVFARSDPVKMLYRVLAMASARGVPIVYALSRRGIGEIFGRTKLMSCVAIKDIEGVEGLAASLICAAASATL